MHINGVSNPLFQLTLEIADKCARAHGVEPRYPFFDRRLIEFCLSVPAEQKFAGGWSRATFRRAMEGSLPSAIQWRHSKGNLAPNFDRGVRALDLATVDSLRAPGAPVGRYVHLARLRTIASDYHASPDRGWRDVDGQLLFRVVVLADWLSGAWRDAGPVGGSKGSAPRSEPVMQVRKETANDDSRREPANSPSVIGDKPIGAVEIPARERLHVRAVGCNAQHGGH
jgi:asparagine synthase (glutamine-hydrolysing)